MANTSRLREGEDDAHVDEGCPSLSLGASPSLHPRLSSLAPPLAAATLNLSVPSIPQSHASDNITPTSSNQSQLDDNAEAAPVVEARRPSEPDTELSQPPAGGAHDEAEQAMHEEEEDEPMWETVHPDEMSALGVDDDDGQRPHMLSSSVAVEDSLGAMALSLFDDGSQLLDDSEVALQAPQAVSISQRNLLSSLPAFPSLPSGLRTPPVVPSTPSPPLERQSPATGSGRLAAGAAEPLSPQSGNVVPGTIAPSPPTSPQPALPATEPVSSSSSSSSAASSVSSASSHQQSISPPDLARHASAYSQETNPVLSLHSSSSLPSLSLPPQPQPYSQHPSMPALEQATGDQPDVDVDEPLHDEERPSTEAVRDGDGFVRPALPHRQTTHDRRTDSQRASQTVVGQPRSPIHSSLHSPVRKPPYPMQRSPRSPSLTSPTRAVAVATSPVTPPRKAPVLSPQHQAAQSLASQPQSQMESQAWDLTYHYPELDAAARDRLIAERGLATLYGHGSSVGPVNREDITADAVEEEEQSEKADEAMIDPDKPAAPQPHNERQQSIEFDIDIDLSDPDDDTAPEEAAAQQTEQAATSPLVDSTFCSQDTDDIPQFTISAQHSFTTPQFTSPPPSTPPGPSLAPRPTQSPILNFSSPSSPSPLLPPLPAAHSSQGRVTHNTYVAHRTRSHNAQPQQPVTPPLVRPAAASKPRLQEEGQDEEQEEATEQRQNGSPPLDRQLSIDPDHPSSDTVLQQRKLMRNIRKQQRDEQTAHHQPAAASSSTAHRLPTRLNRQLSDDRQRERQRRTGVWPAEAEGREEQISAEDDEVDDDFVPQSRGETAYSATKEHGEGATRTGSCAQANGGHGRAHQNGSEQEANSVLRSGNKKRIVSAQANDSEDGEDEDKENERPSARQWKRLSKPRRDDSGRSQPATASGKKAKASERAGKLRQSSLLEHYSSTPSATPPIAVDELLDFSPDTATSASPPPTALRTLAAVRHRVSATTRSTVASDSPNALPSLAAFANRNSSSTSSSSASSSSPSRPPATVSIASRRGLVDITNTVNSRQRPPSPTKQPSNGWRTKRPKRRRRH